MGKSVRANASCALALVLSSCSYCATLCRFIRCLFLQATHRQALFKPSQLPYFKALSNTMPPLIAVPVGRLCQYLCTGFSPSVRRRMTRQFRCCLSRGRQHGTICLPCRLQNHSHILCTAQRRRRWGRALKRKVMILRMTVLELCG